MICVNLSQGERDMSIDTTQTPVNTATRRKGTTDGDMTPSAPMDAADLVELWKIPAAEVDQCSVKVFRAIEGTRSREVVVYQPVMRYNLSELAGQYGPGLYLVAGAGRAIRTRNATIRISEELAAANGWGRLPVAKVPEVPAAYQGKALEVANQAMAAGVSASDLAVMIQAAVDNTMAKIAPPDPMKAMRDMVGMFSLMNELREKASGLVRLDPVDAAPAGGRTMADLFAELIPAVVPAIPQLLAAFRGPGMTPPQIATHQPNARERQALPTTAPAVPAHPAGADMPPISITAEDQKAIGSAVMMLRPFVPMLLKMAEKMKDATPEEVAGGLIEWIPTGSWGAMMHLAELVRVQGPAVLGQLIAPELGTERWATVVSELTKIMHQAFEDHAETGAADA